MVATAVVFPLDLWLRFVPERRLAWLEAALWLSWLATFVVTLGARRWANALIAALVLCAGLFAGAGLISSIGLLLAAETGPGIVSTTGFVNASLIGLGVLCWYCAKWTRLTLDSTIVADRAAASATRIGSAAACCRSGSGPAMSSVSRSSSAPTTQRIEQLAAARGTSTAESDDREPGRQASG